MYRLARITSNYLMNRGFSIGIGDVTPGTKLIDEKKKLVMSGYNKCFEMLSRPSETLDSSEGAVLKALSDIRDSAGKLCVQELHKTNTPLIMAQSGSKGSYINISQMIACVGQQALNGKRVSEGFYLRSLPHFRRNGMKGYILLPILNRIKCQNISNTLSMFVMFLFQIVVQRLKGLWPIVSFPD